MRDFTAINDTFMQGYRKALREDKPILIDSRNQLVTMLAALGSNNQDTFAAKTLRETIDRIEKRLEEICQLG